MKTALALLAFSLLTCACSNASKKPSSKTNHHHNTVKQNTSNRSAANQLRTNTQCINIIKKSEGVRYKAYKGPAGHWLIGYGHKAGVQPGMTITAEQAAKYLRADLKHFEQAITRVVKTPINRNEFSAMVCLSYNIGSGNFSRSTVLKELNKGNRKAAADAFLMWNKVNKKVNSHLVKRRKEERALFLK